MEPEKNKITVSSFALGLLTILLIISGFLNYLLKTIKTPRVMIILSALILGAGLIALFSKVRK